MVATLASTADVLRMLNTDASQVDEAVLGQITDTLDTADEYIKKILRYDPSASGVTAPISGTEKYFDIAETATLLLPYDGCTITEIRTYFGINSPGIELPSTLPDGTGYELDPKGSYVRLRPVLLTSPFAGAEASRNLIYYDRVEIDWSVDVLVVPKPIRDAAAVMAAGLWKSSPRMTSGITGERIGDYSYSTRQLQRSSGDGSSPVQGPTDFWQEALMLIRPYIRRRPLVT